MLIVAIWDDFYMLNGPCDSEYLCEHIFCDAWTEVPDVKMGTALMNDKRR